MAAKETAKTDGIAEEKPTDKRVLTLFFFIGLSLLMAMTREIESLYISISFQVVIGFIQTIFLWSMLKNYWGGD